MSGGWRANSIWIGAYPHSDWVIDSNIQRKSRRIVAKRIVETCQYQGPLVGMRLAGMAYCSWTRVASVPDGLAGDLSVARLRSLCRAPAVVLEGFQSSLSDS